METDADVCVVGAGIAGLTAALRLRQAGLAVGPEERRRVALDALTRRFGSKAARATAYVEQDWSAEPWTGRGMFSRLGPGVLTAFGPVLRTPVGRMHWAGTETATVTHGGIDGAIRSGERAAREVIEGEAGVGPAIAGEACT